MYHESPTIMFLVKDRFLVPSFYCYTKMAVLLFFILNRPVNLSIIIHIKIILNSHQ